MLPGIPSLWLGGAVAACLALFVGGVAIKHRAELAAAHGAGEAVGVGRAATKAVEEATKTVEVRRAALEETPLPADRAAKIALCKKRASCKEHGSVK